MRPFDFKAFKAELNQDADPRGPSDQEQLHAVTLACPQTEEELCTRWDVAQQWCRDRVQHEDGERWSRRRERGTGDLVFSFSSAITGVEFALNFRGV